MLFVFISFTIFPFEFFITYVALGTPSPFNVPVQILLSADNFDKSTFPSAFILNVPIPDESPNGSYVTA